MPLQSHVERRLKCTTSPTCIHSWPIIDDGQSLSLGGQAVSCPLSNKKCVHLTLCACLLAFLPACLPACALLPAHLLSTVCQNGNDSLHCPDCPPVSKSGQVNGHRHHSSIEERVVVHELLPNFRGEVGACKHRLIRHVHTHTRM